MSEASTPASQHSAAIGPGRLILIVGPSGAGKDALIALAAQVCAGDPRVVFPRRVITRAASASENNDAITPQAFRESVARGEFAVHWQAHGHGYGVPRAIDDDIRAGRTVVVNVSRTVIPALRKAYAAALVVLITAPPEILAQRLAARGRSSDGDLNERLQRAVESDGAAPDVVIVNTGPAEHHASELLRIIKGG